MRMLVFLAATLSVACNVSFDTDADTAVDPTDTAGDQAEIPVDGTDVPIDGHDPCADFPGDPCVVLPYGGESVDLIVPFTLEVDSADIYLLVDTTGSMTVSITNIADAFSTSILPAARTAFADVRFGVGHFNDFPVEPFGEPLDRPYWNVIDLTADVADAHSAIESLLATGEWGYGMDEPESNSVALALTATGSDLSGGGVVIPPRTCPFAGDFGYPCFRPGSMAVVLMVSDAPWHNGPDGAEPYSFGTFTYDDAVGFFRAAGIKFLGLFVNNTGLPDGLTAMQRFGTDTSCIDVASQPFVSDGMPETAGERSAELITAIREQARFEVMAAAEDVPGDPPGAEVDAAAFVVSVWPDSSLPPGGFPYPTQDEYAFHDAYQGTELSFRVVLQNSFHPGPVVALLDVVAYADYRIAMGRSRIVVVVP